MGFFLQMRHDLGTFLARALRAQAGHGPHAELARQVVLAMLMSQLLAGAQHDGPPHAARRPPRRGAPRGQRLVRRDSLAGRRPRG